MSTIRVTRDVQAGEPHNFLGRDVAAGETLYVFEAPTYGAVDERNGIAVSEHGPQAYPFFEFPRDAVEVQP